MNQFLSQINKVFVHNFQVVSILLEVFDASCKKLTFVGQNVGQKIGYGIGIADDFVPIIT